MKDRIYVEDTVDAIERVINSTDLLECASYLSDYSRLTYQEKNKKAYIRALNIHLSDMGFAIAPRSFGSFGKDKDHDYNRCKFFTGTNSIRLYLRLHVDADLTSVRYLRFLDSFANQIKLDFCEPTGNQVSKDFIQRVIEFLNTKYSFVEKYYDDQYPTFIFLDNCHNHWNSVCVPVKNPLGDTRCYIFIFHLKSGATYSPEYVLLHELGHVLQTKLGSSKYPPESFYAYQKYNEHFSNMSLEEQRDLFSDGFASTILHDMGLQELDPFASRLYNDLGKYFHEII